MKKKLFEIRAVHGGETSMASTAHCVEASSEKVVREYVETEMAKDNRELDSTHWKLLGGCKGNPCSVKHFFYVAEVKPIMVLE